MQTILSKCASVLTLSIAYAVVSGFSVAPDNTSTTAGNKNQIPTIVANHLDPTVAATATGQFAGHLLEHSDFSDKDLRGENFSYGHLVSVDFSGAILTGADFSESAMDAVDFSGADLEHANFTGTFLKNVNFSNAMLHQACLVNVDLKGVDFSNADLSGAIAMKSAEKTLEASGANLANVVWTRKPSCLKRQADAGAGSLH